MPGCVLRVGGECFDVDSFLASCSHWHPEKIFHKGETRRYKRKNTTHDFSGFNLSISENENFSDQIKEAFIFIDVNSVILKKLGNIKGQKVGMTLSFSKSYEKYVFPYALFPSDFVREAAKLDLSLEIGMFQKSK